jgi:hypothetical protein
MGKKAEQEKPNRACPNCGRRVPADTLACVCGGRWVSHPVVVPEFHVLRQGTSLTALLLVIPAVVIELAILARELYLTDLIWSEAAARMVNYLARVFVPAALIIAYVAYRGMRAARREPTHYGGLNMARASLVVAVGVILVHTSVFLVRIPRMLENRQIKRAAATRAGMYHLARAVEAYRQQYGTYPRRLIDLQEMDPTMKPALDAWEHEFVYEAMSSKVAGVTTPTPFQKYQIISKGPDGIPGTSDDIVMQDDLLLPAGTQPDRLEEEQPQPIRNPRLLRLKE